MWGRFAEPTNEIRERSHQFQGEDKDPSLGLGSSWAWFAILDLVPSRDKLVVEVARLGLDASARFVEYKQRTTRLTSVELEFGYLSLFPGTSNVRVVRTIEGEGAQSPVD